MLCDLKYRGPCGKAACDRCRDLVHSSQPKYAADCSCTWRVAGFAVVQERNATCPDHGDCLCIEYYNSDRDYIGTVYDAGCTQRDCIPRAKAQSDNERKRILDAFRY